MNPSELRPLGSRGASVPALGLGGAPLGDLFSRIPEADAEATVERAWDLGVRLYDTAPWYGHGLSEHRLGHVLRRKPRDEFMLSTKVGRVYRAPADPARLDRTPWVGGLPFELTFDYGYDGILRSYEDSLQRLALNRADLLVIHDLDLQYHGDEAGVERHLQALEDGGWRALDELRAAGAIRAIGAGINHLGMVERFVERFDLDFVLMAMPYTLLDQKALDRELPLCAARGVGVIVGAPFASGILATGPGDGAKYNYADADPDVVARVKRLAAVCQAHAVPLPAAALQFPLGHPSVAAVIPGAQCADHVAANVAGIRMDVPAALWADLAARELVDPRAPTPGHATPGVLTPAAPTRGDES